CTPPSWSTARTTRGSSSGRAARVSARSGGGRDSSWRRSSARRCSSSSSCAPSRAGRRIRAAWRSSASDGERARGAPGGARAPEDRETVLLLRRSGKPVVYAVNKLDTPAREPLLHDFHALGIEPLLPVSVAHGRGVADLLDALAAALPEGAPEASEARGTRLA